MAFECTSCDPPKSFKSKAGLQGHRQFKHTEMSANTSVPSANQGQPEENMVERIDRVLNEKIEELAGYLSEKLEELGNLIEEKVVSYCEELLDKNQHPAGFCTTAHCQQAQVDHNQAITKAAGDKIFATLSKAAKNLGHDDVADELAREYIELATGRDQGPGFFIGETRMTQ